MSEKVRILSFYENWVDIMEMCNPEEWYELTTIITNLRFKNIDTDPKTLTNIKVKMAWIAIRPSILKSNRNSRYQDKKTNTESQPNTEVKKEAQMSPNEPDLTIDDTEIPHGGENASEAPNQGEFDHSIEEFETNTIENENMGTLIGYIPNFNVETRAEKSDFNVLKFIDYLKENNGCLYTKLMRTPSRGLSLDANITRMKECLDMLIQDFIPDSTKRQQLYLYVIENQ